MGSFLQNLEEKNEYSKHLEAVRYEMIRTMCSDENDGLKIIL